MHLGTRQNHRGLCFFTYLIRVSSTCVFSVLLSFKIAAWHKVKPNTDLKIQAQEYANSLWGVAQNHPRSQKCVRGLKIDLVRVPFETCLASHRGAWKFKKTHFVCKGCQNQTLFKSIGFYIVWGASQTDPGAFQDCDWHYKIECGSSLWTSHLSGQPDASKDTMCHENKTRAQKRRSWTNPFSMKMDLVLKRGAWK